MFDFSFETRINPLTVTRGVKLPQASFWHAVQQSLGFKKIRW